MISFKVGAYPAPSKGHRCVNKEGKLTVPDQALSIREILERFTRGEAVPVGMRTGFGLDDVDNPLNVDFEKLAVADLVDKQEYSDALSELKKRYEAQEERKRTAAAKKAKEDAKVRFEAELRAKIEKDKSEGSKSA